MGVIAALMIPERGESTQCPAPSSRGSFWFLLELLNGGLFHDPCKGRLKYSLKPPRPSRGVVFLFSNLCSNNYKACLVATRLDFENKKTSLLAGFNLYLQRK